MFELFGDPRHSITDQTPRAYEYPDKWVNRLVLGDSLVSAPFEAGENGQVAVKVIDDRGNELLVVKGLRDATG
ncbi:MAG: hypothetical protein ACREKJ_11220 [Candidatus Rokuibacteriota bacterium]